mgnify:CR=1 FL=1
MPIKPNQNAVLPMLELEEASPTTVTELLNYVPTYSRKDFRKLVNDAVGAIHQIPRILKVRHGSPFGLKDIVAYFGRSSAAPGEFAGTNVYSRFLSGYKERNDDYGIVLAQTSVRDTLLYERWAIKLIEFLKRKHGLCISNKSQSARGRVSTNEPGYLYMTFHFERSKEVAHKLKPEEIREGANEVSKALQKNSTELKAIPAEELVKATAECLKVANEMDYLGEKPLRLCRR